MTEKHLRDLLAELVEAGRTLERHNIAANDTAQEIERIKYKIIDVFEDEVSA
jgi:hypothetical protein